jgi:glycosyltransferase involved in cell wall biosynthesis
VTESVQPAASIVIVTKNRKEELRRALLSAVAQSGQPEVLVVDDGSTDGTEAMVRSEFPQVVLHRFEQSKGYIVRRNEGAALARGNIIFSIDDDATFSTPQVVEQTLTEFERPDIGAVAIPYIEPRKADRVLQRAPNKEKIWIADAFVGTAHALRRDLFLQLDGYRERLVHQGEESDYCIRMYAAGHVVRLGEAGLIYHHESPRRDFRRMDFFGCRNSILFAWQNVPMPYLPIHLLMTTLNCLRWSLNRQRLLGLIEGYLDFLREKRAPVPLKVYRRWRHLKTTGAAPFEPS